MEVANEIAVPRIYIVIEGKVTKMLEYPRMTKKRVSGFFPILIIIEVRGDEMYCIRRITKKILPYLDFYGELKKKNKSTAFEWGKNHDDSQFLED